MNFLKTTGPSELAVKCPYLAYFACEYFYHPQPLPVVGGCQQHSAAPACSLLPTLNSIKVNTKYKRTDSSLS